MAGVIRKERSGGAQVFSFADFEQQAEQIVEQARRQARQMLQAAEQQAAQQSQQGKQAGYEEGWAAGRAAGLKQVREETYAVALQEAREQVVSLVSALTGLRAEFEQNLRSLLAQAETGLIRLALAIAQRVCKLAVGESCAVARANARALLDMVRHAGDIEVHLHCEDLKLLQEAGPELAAPAADGHVHLVADPQVDRGGCLIRMPSGEIDARIHTQLERIAEALLAGAASGDDSTGTPDGLGVSPGGDRSKPDAP